MEEEYQADWVAPNPEHGEILLSWEFYDRPKYERGRLWYVLMILAGTGFLLYALFTANFVFALIILMVALVIYVSTVYEPRPTRFAITEMGFEIGSSYYPFREIRSFWFFYDPPVAQSLYLEVDSLTHARLKIDLEDQDPNEVRALIARYIREDVTQVDEPLSDSLSRLLKI